MKKYFLLMIILVSVAGCKKRENISQTVDVSFPTITLDGVSLTGTDQDLYYEKVIDQEGFISFMPGEMTTLSPTANDGIPVTEISNSGYDANTPGLYIVDYSAANSNQFYSLVRFFIGVTDIPESYNLTGDYESDAAVTVTIEQQARGVYVHPDITGDELGLAGVFVQTSPTTIVMPEQESFIGPVSIINGTIDTTGGQTIISYEIVNPTINETYGPGTVFTFTKVN